MYTFYEFFAGGGMARAGLGSGWSCVFSNDLDQKKCAAYRANWGDEALKHADVKAVKTDDLPGVADLVWASFPCQDLSLAGAGRGLRGERSGAFWPFWKLMETLNEEARTPKLIVLENVCGALTSHAGKDFAALCSAFQKTGYRFGALVIDAALFVPQSRPRLFVIGVRGDLMIPNSLQTDRAVEPWHPTALQTAFGGLSEKSKKHWSWWNPPAPPKRTLGLADLIESDESKVVWRSDAETGRLLSLMSEGNLAKVGAAQATGRRVVGAIFRRTRREKDGTKMQRAEVRFDNVSGCLRTPAGGSSRQMILVVKGNELRSRLISPRETARLMGLADEYRLPENENEAYHLTGDGVVVPVVRHLAANVLEPVLDAGSVSQAVAA
jgi:DNA (cytosine-5)-methyltransferase 1